MRGKLRAACHDRRGCAPRRCRTFERIRRGISVKFQVPGIFTALPVRQNLEIAFQNHLHGHRLDATIRRVLDFTGLGPEAARPAGTLSHGQKQWLEIGMAVGVEPVLLLLDEPTAGMSPEETERTGEMLRDLNGEGITILAVEHDMTFVQQIAHPGHRAALRRHLRGRHGLRGARQRGRRGNLSRDRPCRMTALLAVEGLRSGYGASPVLLGVDLDVGRGEVVAVIGRNGVGKTTLMRTLCGSSRPRPEASASAGAT